MNEQQLKQRVADIRSRGVLSVLENAVNYGDPHRALYIAAIEEILELKNQVSKTQIQINKGNEYG